VKARHPGWCRHCNGPINPGHDIEKDHDEHGIARWVHPLCKTAAHEVGDYDDPGYHWDRDY